VKKLFCYQINPDAPAIVPARSERAWMDATRQRFAYRCLPLTIANSMGWEILCPIAITAEWNGGPDIEDLTVHVEDTDWAGHYAESHFGHGVLTFQTHYLFRTQPAVALWVRGSPNAPKDGIAPLDGIVETDWLNFTFTMNWIFTRPGRVTFEKNEPFCFITPVGYHALDKLVPEIRMLTTNPKLAAEYESYGKLRRDFNAKLAQGDPDATKQGWQKWYLRGEDISGKKGNPKHISKLSLHRPHRVEEMPPETAVKTARPEKPHKIKARRKTPRRD
jgi:hypothetical protein